MAEIVATGNLAADAELRTTQSGRSVLNFRIADSKSRKNDQGGWDKIAENWFNVAIWGELAEFYANFLKKGTRVKITGEFYQREYDKKDGSGKGVALEVTAWGVNIIPKRDNNGNGGGFQAPPQQAQPQQGGGWNAPANDPWSTGGNPAQGNGGGWGNPQPGNDEPPF
ncbi:single-stranded DNA-binding protein [Glutamicibacter protophormiae]|uniref:single-stranded DNA-binding protein n=1 Tax=Glutamicibacter protophormiae TaxID=37930 RepID=UPI00195D2012|nr:single-stranded DNA-binding protein [Glutamicibacter protophormiae]QRQ79149.1 single-stranded DNA-binding protein [Glutamicibacter protophormiae]